jgi:hypothetical protein
MSYDVLRREKTVGVPCPVDVEADQISAVVEAVNGGGPDAVWVVDRLPLRVLQQIGQQEAVIKSERLIQVGVSRFLI